MMSPTSLTGHAMQRLTVGMNGTKARCVFRGALVQNGTEPLAKGRKMHKIVEYRKVEGNVACDVT